MSYIGQEAFLLTPCLEFGGGEGGELLPRVSQNTVDCYAEGYQKQLLKEFFKNALNTMR